MKIFSYGSNMCLSRILHRVPSTQFCCTGKAPAHQIRLHKVGDDDSAKANCWWTGDLCDEVLGIVYDIDPADKPLLDKAEGLGSGYNEKIIEVISDDGLIKAQAYIADEAYINDNLLPYSWYMKYIITGAVDWGLPEEYIEQLRKISALEDKDIPRLNAFHAIMNKHKEWFRSDAGPGAYASLR